LHGRLVAPRVGDHHPAGHRERLDPRGHVHRFPNEALRLNDHLADVDPDPHRHAPPGQLALRLDRGLNGGHGAREHAHAPVAEALHDRPAEDRVLVLDGAPVGVALGDRRALVGLDERRVAHHVGEHHGDEPPIELRLHTPPRQGAVTPRSIADWRRPCDHLVR
jgi:hypothetical protein